MNNIYGFPLFTNKDKKRAFNYIYNSNENNNILDKDMLFYSMSTVDEDRESQMLIIANMKKCLNILTEDLLPKLGKLLNLIGQDFNYIIFNPNPITSIYNPFYRNNLVLGLAVQYITTEMKGLSTIHIRFNGFSSKELEQLINLKYKDYVSTDKFGNTWIKIAPDENLSFVLEFIDDIIYLI